jgi:hypothetical protein
MLFCNFTKRKQPYVHIDIHLSFLTAYENSWQSQEIIAVI